MSSNIEPSTDPRSFAASEYVGVRVDYQVHRFAHALRLSREDREDLRQDLLLGVVRAMARFDPKRASAATFASRVITLDAQHFARRHRNRLRHPALRPASCTALDGGVQSMVDPRARRDREAERVRRRIDIEHALSGLSPRLRDVCEGLKGHCVPDVARRLGRDRSSIYRDIAKIRAHLEDAGINGSA